MIRRPPRSTLDRSSAASDVYKRQLEWVLRCQVRRNGLEIGRWQFHHGGNAVLPTILGVTPRVRNHVDAVAACAGGLHLLAPRAFSKLRRRWSTLTAAGSGTALSTRGSLLADCVRRKRRGKKHNQRQAEKWSVSHTSS